MSFQLLLEDWQGSSIPEGGMGVGGWEDHSTSQERWTRMFWRVILICPPRSEPIDFVRSINTKIFSHCLILFALSYFNEYVKAKLFIINVKKKNLRDEKNQKLAPICDVSGQIFRSFHTAHRKRFDCKFIRREDRGHLRKSEKRRILLH